MKWERRASTLLQTSGQAVTSCALASPPTALHTTATCPETRTHPSGADRSIKVSSANSASGHSFLNLPGNRRYCRDEADGKASPLSEKMCCHDRRLVPVHRLLERFQALVNFSH